MSEYVREYWSDPAYIVDVLSIYAEADSHGGVFWWTKDDGVVFYAICSDWFAWASADLETIRPEDLPLLRRCLDDLNAIEREDKKSVATAYLSELFASRKRGMRPQSCCYEDSHAMDAATAALFDAAGPPRDDSDGKRTS
jgi:hypothetical protein